MGKLSLRRKLESWLQGCSKIAILGVGNPLREDDALGVELIKLLRGRVPGKALIIEGGSMPENFIRKIELFAPSHVLLVDAAHLGGSPGDADLLSPKRVAGVAVSTHAIPLHLTAELIREATGAEIMLLGVQPKTVGLGEGISPEVREAIYRIAEIIVEVLNEVLGP